jgi:hypothetical protein
MQFPLVAVVLALVATSASLEVIRMSAMRWTFPPVHFTVPQLHGVRDYQFPSTSVANTAGRKQATFVRTILNDSTGAKTVHGTPDGPSLIDSSTGVQVAAARPLLRLPQVAAVGSGSA